MNDIDKWHQCDTNTDFKLMTPYSSFTEPKIIIFEFIINDGIDGINIQCFNRQELYDRLKLNNSNDIYINNIQYRFSTILLSTLWLFTHIKCDVTTNKNNPNIYFCTLKEPILQCMIIDIKINFLNAGLSGECITSLTQYLQKDINAKCKLSENELNSKYNINATELTYSLILDNTDYKTIKKFLLFIINTLKQNNIVLTEVTFEGQIPSPYDNSKIICKYSKNQDSYIYNIKIQYDEKLNNIKYDVTSLDYIGFISSDKDNIKDDLILSNEEEPLTEIIEEPPLLNESEISPEPLIESSTEPSLSTESIVQNEPIVSPPTETPLSIETSTEPQLSPAIETPLSIETPFSIETEPKPKDEVNYYDNEKGNNEIDFYDNKIVQTGGLISENNDILTTSFNQEEFKNNLDISKNNLDISENNLDMYESNNQTDIDIIQYTQEELDNNWDNINIDIYESNNSILVHTKLDIETLNIKVYDTKDIFSPLLSIYEINDEYYLNYNIKPLSDYIFNYLPVDIINKDINTDQRIELFDIFLIKYKYFYHSNDEINDIVKEFNISLDIYNTFINIWKTKVKEIIPIINDKIFDIHSKLSELNYEYDTYSYNNFGYELDNDEIKIYPLNINYLKELNDKKLSDEELSKKRDYSEYYIENKIEDNIIKCELSEDKIINCLHSIKLIDSNIRDDIKEILMN